MNAVPNTQAKDSSRAIPEALLFQSAECEDSRSSSLRHFERLASVGAMTCNIAHEIKNALVGTRTFVELLAKENPNSELAALAKSELERIHKLVSDVLRFAAQTNGEERKRTDRKGFVQLNELLKHAVGLLEHTAKTRDIRFELSFDLAHDLLAGDFDQLKQALLNVLLNAIEASCLGGIIRVRTRVAGAAGHTALIAIQDSGAGIRDQDIERVFEPFFTTKAGGTGLGLSITRQIIEEHQGKIEVSSEAGQGTTFTFLLPLCGNS